jgi:hypothetical protein
MVIPKQPMGCQFINAHNKSISEVFNFNTNIKIWRCLQVFYSTLYTSKSTQDEVSKKQLHIGRAVIKKSSVCLMRIKPMVVIKPHLGLVLEKV